MTDKEQKTILGNLMDSLSALTANQAIIIELLYHKLPSLSEDERQTVTRCANNNYAIAEALQAAVQQVRTLT